MSLRGQPATATFPSQYNSSLHSKDLSLYTQASIGLALHERCLFLQQTKTITDSYNLSRHRKATIECPAPTDTSIIQLLPRTQEHHRRGGRKIIRTRGLGTLP